MRIVSKFRDYYDYVSNRFGQDPDCVYLRRPIRPPDAPDRADFQTFHEVDFEWPRAQGYFSDTLLRHYHEKRQRVEVQANSHARLEFVVAGSRVVAFIRDEERRDYVSGEITSPARLERLTGANDHRLQVEWRSERPAYPGVPSGEHLEDLIRVVGAPVFTVVNRRDRYDGRRLVRTITIKSAVPCLADLGFASFVPAEVMWQDIRSTMQNVLRRNPDRDPPVQVGEKYRIEAAGFDLKTSFRHPVNPKKVK